jgi:hypothetical protein
MIVYRSSSNPATSAAAAAKKIPSCMTAVRAGTSLDNMHLASTAAAP